MRSSGCMSLERREGRDVTSTCLRAAQIDRPITGTPRHVASILVLEPPPKLLVQCLVQPTFRCQDQHGAKLCYTLNVLML
jgi:hypothetical protein